MATLILSTAVGILALFLLLQWLFVSIRIDSVESDIRRLVQEWVAENNNVRE